MIDVVIEFSDGSYRLPAAEVTVETEREAVTAGWVAPGACASVVVSETVTIKTDLPMPRLAEPETETFKETDMTIGSDDPVDAPSHYTRGSIEVKDFIADQGFGFFLGSAVKYISRAGYKGDAVEDLRKAQKMIDFEIELIEKQVAEDGDAGGECRPFCDCR